MILTDQDLEEWALAGNIFPFKPENINPASIDLCLGSEWRDLENPDLLQYPSFGKITIKSPGDTNVIHTGFPTAILAITEEWVKIPDNMVGMIKLKSSPTRMGLGHPIADWIDPGYEGKLTLMLNAVKTVSLPVGLRIVQLVLVKLDKSVRTPYGVKGHYMNQQLPTVTRSDYV